MSEIFICMFKLILVTTLVYAQSSSVILLDSSSIRSIPAEEQEPTEIEKKCFQLDCKPGICIVENKVGHCFCPSGFTAKEDHCLEIGSKPTGVITTVLLMVIVAAAAAILTAVFGISICYYYSQRNET